METSDEVLGDEDIMYGIASYFIPLAGGNTASPRDVTQCCPAPGKHEVRVLLIRVIVGRHYPLVIYM